MSDAQADQGPSPEPSSGVASSAAQSAIPAFWLPSEPFRTYDEASATAGLPHRRRILIAKSGLDGHDRGAKYVAQVLRDADFEVFYSGIRRTPCQIVAAGIFHEVDAIGLSLLSGAHNFLFAELFRELAEHRAAHIHVFGGGVLPAEDIEGLKRIGVRAVFTPGAPAAEIVAAFRSVLPSVGSRS